MVIDQLIDRVVEKEANKVDREVTEDVITDLFVNQLASLAASLLPSSIDAGSTDINTIFKTTTTSITSFTFTNIIPTDLSLHPNLLSPP